MTSISFAWPGFRGEATAAAAALAGLAAPAGEDLAALARRLLDPAIATATLHWGRNYIYQATFTADPASPAVAVKQFREARPRRRPPESKAAKSFRLAGAFAAASLPTPEPLLFAESDDGATGIFVTRAFDGATELRYLLRARNAGTDRESFPEFDLAMVIESVARLARRIHDAGFWHRDFSIGNLLLRPGGSPVEPPEISILDLNRTRLLPEVPLGARMRDLCRLPLARPADRERLLATYFGGEVPALARLRYETARRAFLKKNEVKAGSRHALARARSWLVPRGTHAHIPPPPAGVAARDKIVWDPLSDQPHSHASRWERARIRLGDLSSHARSAAAFASALPRIRRRYRTLKRELERAAPAPFPFPEPGVALRPWPEDPAGLLAAFDEVGARRALLRLHPWEEDHDAEEELARELAARGVELAFALPQNRDLVKDRARWRATIEELGERFARYGSRFQVGQAVNRSKWGVWSHDDYLALAADAAEILRRPRAGAGPLELFGPAVIDFEAHATAAIVNRRHPTLRFDGLSSLLYVDRRGAPESRQLGFDTVDKVRLLSAIAGTGRLVDSGRSWISEVNWPLREGPHSPAGKSVSVDERAQADYLARYFLLACGEGLVERVDWWQLVAKGYGLIDPEAGGSLRRRPAFRAFATLRRELAGASCLGRFELPAGARGLRFRKGSRELAALWAAGEPVRWTPGRAVASARGRDGEPVPPAGELLLTGAVTYVDFA